MAVFVDERRLVVEQPGAEDGDDTGVRVENRLPGSVGAGIAKGDDGDTGRPPPGQHKTLLVEFTDGVDVLAADRGVLVGRDGRARRVARRTTDGIIAAVELGDRAGSAVEVAVSGATVGALVVDGLGRSEDDLANRELPVADSFEHEGR